MRRLLRSPPARGWGRLFLLFSKIWPEPCWLRPPEAGWVADIQAATRQRLFCSTSMPANTTPCHARPYPPARGWGARRNNTTPLRLRKTPLPRAAMPRTCQRLRPTYTPPPVMEIVRPTAPNEPHAITVQQQLRSPKPRLPDGLPSPPRVAPGAALEISHRTTGPQAVAPWIP